MIINLEYKYYIRKNEEYLSAGHIIHQARAASNFPVKCAYEIFMRCAEYRKKGSPLTVYDCCAGSGYMLTVIGFLCAGSCNISNIYASDADEGAIGICERNLALLSPEGLDKRIDDLRNLYEKNKPDYFKKVTDSGTKLAELVRNGNIVCKTFGHDILAEPVRAGFAADIVVCDVPYGKLFNWRGGSGGEIGIMLGNLRSVIDKNSIVAVTYDKGQKLADDSFNRIDRFIIGKRKTEILRPIF